MSDSKGRKQNYVLNLFQVTSLAVIIISATLFFDMIYKWMVGEAGIQQLIVALAMVVSILEVMNNWASIKEYGENYNRSALFALDILTLGLLYGQTYILSKLEASECTKSMEQLSLNVILFSYTMLYILYLIWNGLIRQDEKIKLEKREKVEKSSQWRFAQVMCGGCFLSMPFFLRQTEAVITTQQLMDIKTGLVLVYMGGSLAILILTQKILMMVKTIMEAEELKDI